jgi:hypothetical protein
MLAAAASSPCGDARATKTAFWLVSVVWLAFCFLLVRCRLLIGRAQVSWSARDSLWHGVCRL